MKTRKVVFHWDTSMGDCYDCGNPAAYESSEHPNRPESLRCSVCAAHDASQGATIKYLYEEPPDEEPARARPVPQAVILTWVCQHGTMRRGYVKPSASCVKRAVSACKWKPKP